MNKQQLLDTGIVLDNQYLDLYVELINQNYNLPYQAFKTQTHHIIPRYYYNEQNIEINNSKENSVNLFYKDHCLAHYYLALCSTKEYYIGANVKAVQRMTTNKNWFEKENINQFLLSLDNYQELYEKFSKIHSESRKGENNGCYGKRAYNDGIITKYFYENQQPEGWVLGSLCHPVWSEEKRKKMAEVQRGRKMPDGFGQTMSKINKGRKKPDGFGEKVSQRLKGRQFSEETRKKLSKSRIGMHAPNMNKVAYHDIKTNKIIYLNKDEAVPEGYTKGYPIGVRVCSEETKRKISESRKRSKIHQQ